MAKGIITGSGSLFPSGIDDFTGDFVDNRYDYDNCVDANLWNRVMQGIVAVERRLTGYTTEPWKMIYPCGMTQNPDGNIAVVDYTARVVIVFAPDGTFLRYFGAPGEGDGQFAGPIDVACDAAGNYYVTDYKLHRVQKFDQYGNFLRSFGAEGTGAGELKNPWGIEVVGSHVYVVDSGNNRLARFTADFGAFSANYSSTGPLGALSSPRGLAKTAGGDLIIADSGKTRLISFDPEHATQRFRDDLTGIGSVSVLTIDAAGAIWTIDSTTTVKKFTIDGALTITQDEAFTPVTLTAAQSGRIIYGIHAATVATVDGVYFAISDRGNVQFREIPQNLLLQWQWTDWDDDVNALVEPTGAAIDAAGNVWVADHTGSRVAKLTEAGAPIVIKDEPDASLGRFKEPYGIDLDAAENAYVSERGANKIHRIDADGQIVETMTAPGSPESLSVSDDGTVILYVEGGHKAVKKLTYAGGAWTLSTLGSYGTGNLQYRSPRAVALDKATGISYIADAGDYSGHAGILVLNAAGVATEFRAAGAGGIKQPSGVRVVGSFLYVTDAAMNKVYKYPVDGGAAVLTVGSYGAGPGQFHAPCGIGVKADGSFAVADTGNGRIQRFTALGAFAREYRAVKVNQAFSTADAGGAKTVPDMQGYKDSGKIHTLQSGQEWERLYLTANVEFSSAGIEEYVDVDVPFFVAWDSAAREGDCIWPIDIRTSIRQVGPGSPEARLVAHLTGPATTWKTAATGGYNLHYTFRITGVGDGVAIPSSGSYPYILNVLVSAIRCIK